MTSVNRKLKSTMTDIKNKSWADICDSSQSSQSQGDVDSPLKNDDVSVKDEDDLYDMVFKPIKKEDVKVNSQDDLSLTSFMNNVHMVTPIKQECDDSSLSNTNLNINEDTICSPFPITEFIKSPYMKPEQPDQISKEEILKKDLLHAKRRLTSECESVVSVMPEQVKKVTRTSIEHKNVHDSVINPPKTKLGLETDPLVLQRRQKQIDFGKNTIGYEKYLEEIPKNERRKEHPKTPPKNLKYTRRAWDGLVKSWRVKLHCWDPENKTEDDDALTTCSSSNLHGSMTSLDSNSQASDSRPLTPLSTKTLSETVSQVNHEAVSSHDPIEIENIKTET
ncbi:Histone RNA hairpin-binding protein, RNA-binding domain [Cinara cedri]|uniref:Histone RNA hairpin-binding protein, RNA-binding domain n=1 Tax=Cinara cedri TaxID=506608 RepID=A0A5E4N961_9HEMI|nr:Histone RNA hairpin-binding protein, RNA-binding domain [Cinara cedri]